MGRGLLRVFIRTDQPETLAQLHDDLLAGRIGSFHAYKWRLAMALQPSLARGVRLADVWQTWRRWVPDAASLAAQTGRPREAIKNINAYRDSESVYYYPSLQELRQTLALAFEVIAQHHPSYELGERCPLLALRPLSR